MVSEKLCIYKACIVEFLVWTLVVNVPLLHEGRHDKVSNFELFQTVFTKKELWEKKNYLCAL